MVKKTEELVAIVKQKLWQFGYGVRDASELGVVSFDLVVQGTKRVVVGGRRPKVMPAQCDVFAYVEMGDGIAPTITFIIKPDNGLAEYSSPAQVFGKAKV